MTTTHVESVESSWSAIESISVSMRDAAAQEDWPQVVELAISRHRNLLGHFQRFPVGPDNAAFYSARLTPMLEGERELQTLAVDARKRVMRDSVAANYNRRAMGAYLAQ